MAGPLILLDQLGWDVDGTLVLGHLRLRAEFKLPGGAEKSALVIFAKSSGKNCYGCWDCIIRPGIPLNGDLPMLPCDLLPLPQAA